MLQSTQNAGKTSLHCALAEFSAFSNTFYKSVSNFANTKDSLLIFTHDVIENTLCGLKVDFQLFVNSCCLWTAANMKVQTKYLPNLSCALNIV